MAFPRATETAHWLIKKRLCSGARAVDATVGNGHDTVFLAKCVGDQGRVDGFDIQKAAIESARLKVAGFPAVRLHHLGHEVMEQIVPPGATAVMFNLGYFPTGDKGIVTHPSTTLPALTAALNLLSGDGIMTIVVYPGHPGGGDEAKAVEEWVDRLEPKAFRAVHYGPRFSGIGKTSPYLIAVERKNEPEFNHATPESA